MSFESALEKPVFYLDEVITSTAHLILYLGC